MFKVRVKENDFEKHFLNGRLHKTDGPAISYLFPNLNNDPGEWWVNGVHIIPGPDSDWNEKLTKKELEEWLYSAVSAREKIKNAWDSGRVTYSYESGKITMSKDGQDVVIGNIYV